MKMQKEILDFLCTTKVATICYVNNGLPYCFNCLYAVIPGIEGIIFKSSKASLHSQQMQDDTPIAGTMYQAAPNGIDNTGVQFNGKVTTNNKISEIAKKAYYKRFPLALVIPGQIFVIIFDTTKFSHTKNGIRRKIDWQKTF